MASNHENFKDKWWYYVYYRLFIVFASVSVNIAMAEIFTRYVDDPVKDFVYRLDVYLRKKKEKESSHKELA